MNNNDVAKQRLVSLQFRNWYLERSTACFLRQQNSLKTFSIYTIHQKLFSRCSCSLLSLSSRCVYELWMLLAACLPAACLRYAATFACICKYVLSYVDSLSVYIHIIFFSFNSLLFLSLFVLGVLFVSPIKVCNQVWSDSRALRARRRKNKTHRWCDSIIVWVFAFWSQPNAMEV